MLPPRDLDLYRNDPFFHLFEIVFNVHGGNCPVDKKLQETVEEKIRSTFANVDEIKKLVESLDMLSTESNSFAFGIIIGRLYNSFYYQSRRILKRDPTSQEFLEFIKILKNHQEKFLKNFQ